ncbi:Smr/MutS family protein [Paracoccus panacisoli]|uniref:Smr/MutS family protein n=1 Tax=Paracoccus panacisoli TaxID=1510163 RepID=A0ABV6T3M7_9RHOB
MERAARDKLRQRAEPFGAPVDGVPAPVPAVPRLAPPPAVTRAAVPAGFRVGALAPVARAAKPSAAAAASPGERLRAEPLRMDARTHRDLVRGKLKPQARLDLHGLTLAAAKGELAGFILSARSAGLRLVLVITGKGRGDLGPLPTRSGALRHEVPHWLGMAPMAGAVMQVVPAHDRHGGGGAYYVWLRRLPQG